MLQDLMGGELDLLVLPLRRPVTTSDHPHPMQAAKVPVDEGMTRFRLGTSPFGDAEMPFPILLPRVVFEEGVFGVGVGLDVGPSAAEHILPRVDQLVCLIHRSGVDDVLGHQPKATRGSWIPYQV